MTRSSYIGDQPRRIKKRHLLAFAFVLFCVALWLMNRAYSFPMRALDFTITPVMSSNRFTGDCMVTVANVSANSVQIIESQNQLDLEIIYRTNATWYSRHVYSPGRDDLGKLHPHESRNDAFNLPAATKGIKVGMTVTSLTWRGRVAWWFYECGAGKYLRWPEQYFRYQDEKTRTRKEWSEEYKIDPVPLPKI